MNRWKKKTTVANKPPKRPKLAGEGFIGRLVYYIRRALINIRQNVFVNVVTIGTMSLALLILSLFMLLYVNLESAADGWSEKVQVTAYFDRELASQEQDELKGKIKALPGAASVEYISRDEALKRFKKRLHGQESLLEGVTPETLPASMEITLKRSSRETESVENFVASLKQLNGISEVQFGEEWVKRFNTFLNYMRMLGVLLGAFLLVAVLFIVSNTIKLTIYARRDELEVMSLVGATRFFIKAPFLVEGVIQGLSASILSTGLLFALYELFLHNASNFIVFNPADSGLFFLPLEYIGAILLAGIVLGFIGSLTSLKRFITI